MSILQAGGFYEQYTHIKNNPDIRLDIENKIRGVDASAGGDPKDSEKHETSD